MAQERKNLEHLRAGLAPEVQSRDPMTTTMRKLILRADACWLVLASLAGLAVAGSGAFFASAPSVLRAVPEAAVGLMQAHGLALIFGLLMWRALPRRSSHVIGGSVHLLLGAGSALFWPATADVLPIEHLITGLHLLFAVAQLLAAALPCRGRTTLLYPLELEESHP